MGALLCSSYLMGRLKRKSLHASKTTLQASLFPPQSAWSHAQRDVVTVTDSPARTSKTPLHTGNKKDIKKKKKSNDSWELGRWFPIVKCLLHNHKDLRSNRQHPLFKVHCDGACLWSQCKTERRISGAALAYGIVKSMTVDSNWGRPETTKINVWLPHRLSKTCVRTHTHR